jgi:hypothetical protein
MVKHRRQNRVTPFGMLEAAAVRGRLMGNRGDLHDGTGAIRRHWKVKGWIACALTHPRGGRVTFDTPGRYTPLFFADEPTALAAGHRPCAECRRAGYNAWREGWRLAFGVRPSAKEMDAALHAARISADGHKITFGARIGDLPDGVMLALADAPGSPLLLWQGQLHTWSHEGYGAPRQAAASTICHVLTPKPTVAVLSALAGSGTLPWPGFVLPGMSAS